MNKKNLTVERLRELLDYDPETGVFTWLVRKGSTAPIGSHPGRSGPRGYYTICIDYKRYLAHRLAWLHTSGEWPVDQLDHINGVPTDNRLCNLRQATSAENNQNLTLRRKNASGYTGVRWKRGHDLWEARIGVEGKYIHLGHWETAWQASIAYAEAKLKLHTFNPKQRAGHEQQ
jgi:hypothetical protein